MERKYGCPKCKARSRFWLRCTKDLKLCPAGWRVCKKCDTVFNMKDAVPVT